MEDKKQQALEKYNKRLENHRKRIQQAQEEGLKVPIPVDMRELTANELLLMKAKLHPIESTKGMQNTKDMLQLYYDRKVLTVKEIYEALGLSDKTVTKRQQAFRDNNLVHRYGKYYVATPRLQELVEQYLSLLCEPKPKKRSKQARRGVPEI